MDSENVPPAGISRRQFVKLTSLTGATLASGHLLGILAPRSAKALSALPAVRFAIIGDFGETLRDQEFPVDRLGKMIRSWNPDFVVSVGDDNYILGEAATIDTNIGKNFTSFIYPKGTDYPEYYPYPSDAPLYNRFFSALGNHDYGDVGDDFPPTPEKIALSKPYIDYLANSLRGPKLRTPRSTSFRTLLGKVMIPIKTAMSAAHTPRSLRRRTSAFMTSALARRLVPARFTSSSSIATNRHPTGATGATRRSRTRRTHAPPR